MEDFKSVDFTTVTIVDNEEYNRLTKAQFNEAELYFMKLGLELVKEKWKKEILDAEEKGKRSLFTTTYVDMFIKDTIEKTEKNTIKNK